MAKITITAYFIYLIPTIVAFAPSSSYHLQHIGKTKRYNVSPIIMNASTSPSSRRDALVSIFVSSVIPTLIVGPSAVLASDNDGAVDDLSMPSAEDEQKRAEAEMAERIRRKRELQKQATRPASFKDALSAEKDKQKGLKKSKEEMRNALCEELGRGC